MGMTGRVTAGVEDGDILGKDRGPCIRGLRLTVRRVLEALSTYPSREELTADYPELDGEDIRQAMAYPVRREG